MPMKLDTVKKKNASKISNVKNRAAGKKVGDDIMDGDWYETVYANGATVKRHYYVESDPDAVEAS